jgi:putative sterol carrier protein
LAQKGIKFPSEDWINRFVEALDENEEYREAAEEWEGDFLFIVNEGPAMESEWIAYMDLWHGECREHGVLPSREAKKTEFVYEGPLESWVELIKGDLDPIRGLLTRKFRLTGSMPKIMKNVKATTELAKNCTRVSTLFDSEG